MPRFGKPVLARCIIVVAFVFALIASLCACSSGSGAKESAGELPEVTIGTLATEDILPFWVAESENLFEQAGITVHIQVFQSATELIAGVVAGEVDLAMTDPMVAASIHASGTPVHIEWITLGTTAEQGRFGIMTSAASGIESLSDLAGVPIGVGSNTILEYVMDKLMEQAGIPADQIVTEELQKLPVRYQQMADGTVSAAALPASLLALGEANGCRLIADDSQGENLSQSIMVARVAFVDEHGSDAIDVLKTVWDKAADEINAQPENYRALLVEKANLSPDIAETYPISTYPRCELPTNDMIDPILAWMQKKGYLTTELSYNAKSGDFE